MYTKYYRYSLEHLSCILFCIFLKRTLKYVYMKILFYEVLLQLIVRKLYV